MKNNEAKVLLADANFCTLPVLSSLQKRFAHVAVCGNMKDDPCHAIAQQSHLFDYSNREALLDIVRKNNYTYLVSGCNDRSYLSCAWVAQQLGMPGYDDFDTVLTLHQKDLFRAFASQQGYPTPSAAYTIEETRHFDYPLIVKPVDAFSGRGVSKVETEHALAATLQQAKQHSASGQAIIEEFKTGTLHSHSAFIKNGEISVDFFVDEFCTVYEYQVNSSCLSTLLTPAIRAQVRECITQMVSDLQLVDGLLHTQFLATEHEFWLIEITRRCPGDLYSRLIELSTSYHYSAGYIGTFTALDLPMPTQSAPRYIARHTVSTDTACHYFSVSHALEVKHTELIQLKTCGKSLKEAPFDKVGLVFLEFDTARTMAEHTPQLRHHIHITTLDS